MSLDIWTDPHPRDAGLRGTRKRQKRLTALRPSDHVHRTRQGVGCVGRLLEKRETARRQPPPR